ncbi:MAG: MerR family transcriptional regulator [Clostridiales bacterium]|nr:MerR family transcriptional regulator [Clostridiales bacterium]
MDKKMTSGEIAKKAGVSQKAVRLYDEKGLLKPTDYSEGNYRLYDKAALQVLEKIVALKQIGFSLEEIRDNLVAGDAKDIKEALEMQLKVMEEKRYRIEMVIDTIKRTLAQNADALDWDDVAGIVQSVTIDQEADRGHWLALQHTVPGQDWYVTVFNSMNFKKDEKILDLGCGFSKLWRNNWKDIPEGSEIFGYDIRGSWADDFENYLKENEKDLPSGVKIDLTFEDLEKSAAWDLIESEKAYDHIIAHYLYFELKNPEALVEKASKVLAKDGVFSVNGPDVGSWNLFFEKAMKEAGIDAPFIEESISEQEGKRDDFFAMLSKYFAKVDTVELTCDFRYAEADDLLLKMKDTFEGQEKFFCKYQDKIKAYFKEQIEKNGELIITTTSQFLRCSL